MKIGNIATGHWKASMVDYNHRGKNQWAYIDGGKHENKKTMG
jgi:hypothetical protein